MNIRANRVETIYRAAAQLPLSERGPFVQKECEGDTALAAEVNSALAAHSVGCTSAERLPERIGPYRILGVLGEGGMGTVYSAEQTEPVRRRVALKVIRRSMARKEILGRFELERQALAMMNHPNIAKVFDAGTDHEGTAYFAMELVKGEPIGDYCDRNKLSIEQRLRLFVQVCHGVQHAHHKGVIHRDLKPGNVLVEILDDKPVARIIDFGLARAANHLALQQSLFTEVGQVIGTPEYMSPEQAEMTGTDIDTRSDVYSLGAMLYELLTGMLPFSGAELRKAGLFEIQRRIREIDPQTPSKRVSSVHGDDTVLANRRRLTLVALVRHLRCDLDWIVMRCLEKDRARRYQTAVELAADIERHLAGEPVLAGPPSVTYRLRKLVRKHRVAVAVLATVFGLMAVALVVVIQAKAAAEHERTIADTERTAAMNLARLLQAQYRGARAEELVHEGSTFIPLTQERVQAAERWLRDARSFVADAQSSTPAAVPEEQRVREQGEADAKLRKKVAELDGLCSKGNSVEQRLDQLRITVAAAQPAWRLAQERVRSKVDLKPQDLLVPLGPDPRSGLEEFAVLQTGAVPSRNAQHELVLGEDSAMVLVLLPGGLFTMGAVEGDRDAPPVEKPSTKVHLDPFFLGKHEVTQAQWFAMTGTRPSQYHAGTAHPDGDTLDDRNPVECVTWLSAVEALRLFGLELPTEAQWEFGARANLPQPTIWWTGNDRESLMRPGAAENLADRTTIAAAAGFAGAKDWEDYDDGYFFHAPVGSLRANAFGLHDLLGNVKEHCRDSFAPGKGIMAPRSGDGLQVGEQSGLHATRGSSWNTGIRDARISQRRQTPQGAAFDNVGLRAARQLQR